MVRSIVLAVMLVGLLAVSASAYDFLYSGDMAMTHDQGAFGVKASFIYLMADKGYDADGNSVDFPTDTKAVGMFVPVDVYYSLTDQIEFGLQPKFSSLKWQTANEDTTGSGIGDTWVKVKYMFMAEPMVTFRAAAKLPTGDDEADPGDLPVGDGQTDLDGAIMLGLPAGPGSFDVAAGYRYRMENTDSKCKPGNEIHFMAAYTYFLNDMMNLRLAADGFFGSDSETDGVTDDSSGMNMVWIAPGIEYMMENGMSLGADFYYPLMGQNMEALWGFGAYVGWGR
jgi:hypothetical protein